MSAENAQTRPWNDDKTDLKDDQKPKKRWTVMIYMAGDNNLSEECVYALTEAKDALTEDATKLAVLAQFDPAGLRGETHRFHLTPKTKNKHLIDDRTGWKAHETNTGEPNNLLEFLRWGISEYPAEHYLVVLVGHGTGTDDDFLLRDDNPADSLSIIELRWVFDQLTADGKTIDILGFDTCLMNMAEVSFEFVRTNVTYMVGSEGYAPNTGWPFKRILKHLINNIETNPESLAKQITIEYQAFYTPYVNGGISIDQSVLEVKKIDEVKKKMFSLVGTLLDDLTPPKDPDPNQIYIKKRNALVLAHWDTQSYNGEVFVDLSDFLDQIVARYEQFGVSGDDFRVKCTDLKNAIANTVVQTCIAGNAFQFSYGLSIYFPWAVLSPRYGNLAFPKETRWLDYLMRYHIQTRRAPRRDAILRLPDSPYRATVPNNKSRDGHVESMRNPPIGEYYKPPETEIGSATTTAKQSGPVPDQGKQTQSGPLPNGAKQKTVIKRK